MSGISSPTQSQKIQQVQTPSTTSTGDKTQVSSNPTVKSSGGDSLSTPSTGKTLGDKQPKQVSSTQVQEKQVEPPKPKDVKHDVQTEKQKTANTCWACGTRMLLQHGGKSVPSYQTLDPKNLGMDPTDQGVKQKLNQLGIEDVNYGKTDDLTPQKLNEFLEDGPLMASGRFTNYDAHVIVVTGMEGDTVHYNDPDNGGKKTMSLSDFKAQLNPIDTLRMIMPDAMSPLQQLKH